MHRPPPAPPAQQIAPVLVTLAAGATGQSESLILTLEPQELGRIEVEVTREGERRVAIAVIADRPETLHLLMRDAAVLDRALAQAGVGAEGRSLAFDLGGGSDRRGERGAPASGRGDAPATPRADGTARRADPLSLLDIAI
ncbi:flagellar hook-length control protein FliK [Elioraea sp. Yellowstone]|uniref:flagellar hook-length control protein FliK n=1 Tax=Elioraea sp. Yellowstone TaxID=2592070 RepID=UPI0013870C2E|nr:flagellar hook-length control protein FliK [Elioraea sp. Yellowstone]